MTINFYTILDDPRVIEKTIGQKIYDCEANILSSCSIKNPVLILKYDERLISANYMEIVEWNRFYFMGEPILAPGGRCQISATEDVLYTNREAILNLNAYCIRCESRFEKYATDENVPSLITTNVTNIPFDKAPFATSLGDYQYLLTVKGGRMVQNGVDSND
jgi:hypothetical protein